MAANIWILGLIGEVQCIYKAVKYNWEPIGKAEVVYIYIYIAGVFTRLGLLLDDLILKIINKIYPNIK